MIIFEVLTSEEKFARALAEIYTILLKLADEKQNGPATHFVNSESLDRTLITEYPPQV